jgi:hypothetical protein
MNTRDTNTDQTPQQESQDQQTADNQNITTETEKEIIVEEETTTLVMLKPAVFQPLEEDANIDASLKMLNADLDLDSEKETVEKKDKEEKKAIRTQALKDEMQRKALAKKIRL